MPNQIALLRAVNVTGHNLVAMADLRDLLEGLGFTGVKTLLQSGNVVFGSGKKTGEKLERLLEGEAKKHLGIVTEFFVRSPSEWSGMIADNPFRAEARDDPGHLLALCLKSIPAPAQVKALQAAITGREVVRVKNRTAYAVYPDGVGRSKLTTALIEKSLGTRCTGRNWNTVLKLAALAGEGTPPGGTSR